MIAIDTKLRLFQLNQRLRQEYAENARPPNTLIEPVGARPTHSSAGVEATRKRKSLHGLDVGLDHDLHSRKRVFAGSPLQQITHERTTEDLLRVIRACDPAESFYSNESKVAQKPASVSTSVFASHDWPHMSKPESVANAKFWANYEIHNYAKRSDTYAGQGHNVALQITDFALEQGGSAADEGDNVALRRENAALRKEDATLRTEDAELREENGTLRQQIATLKGGWLPSKST
ncbi:hypothetical protein LTR53_005292 [Teratosphaeriaceae sp. CCFEE 6253]|nr:hypothetical protein LTR53_005292 [Teratosphaeriaceae sp. CCFEE 6253]